MLPQSHSHQASTTALAAGGTLAAVALVWFLSTLHFDNAALDALPATASLARDVALGFGAVLWLPMVVLALVAGAAVCFTIAGRNALARRTPVPAPRRAVRG